MKILIGFIIVGLIAFGGYKFYVNNITYRDGLAVLPLPQKILYLEIADSKEEQRQGLSNRDALPHDGILFVFDEPGNYGFWMKDMKFPIDIIWVHNNRIVTIVRDAMPSDNPQVMYPSEPANYVLELKAGSAREYQLLDGSLLNIELPNK